jgi:DNA-binding NarL/FixJ family response regulator
VAGVYLIFRNRLFRDAVAAILTAQPEIKLLGATNRPERAASEIIALAPSVILLEDTEDGPSIHDVHRILTSPIPYRLITLRLDQDGMHVWSQTWRQTVGPADLVEAIVTAREDKPCPEQRVAL